MALPLMAQTAQTQSQMQMQGGSESTGGPADNSKRMTLAMFSINRRLTALINVSRSSGEFLQSIDSSLKDTKNKTTETLEQSREATKQMSSGLGKIFNIFNWFKRKTQAERDQAKVEKAQKVEEAREARRARRKEWIKGIGSKVTGRVDSAVKKAGSGIWNLLKKAAWGVALIGLIAFLRSPHWPKLQEWFKKKDWKQIFKNIGAGIEKVAGWFGDLYDYLFATKTDEAGKEVKGLAFRIADTVESFSKGGFFEGLSKLSDSFSGMEKLVIGIVGLAAFAKLAALFVGGALLGKFILAAGAIAAIVALIDWLATTNIGVDAAAKKLDKKAQELNEAAVDKTIQDMKEDKPNVAGRTLEQVAKESEEGTAEDQRKELEEIRKMKNLEGHLKRDVALRTRYEVLQALEKTNRMDLDFDKMDRNQRAKLRQNFKRARDMEADAERLRKISEGNKAVKRQAEAAALMMDELDVSDESEDYWRNLESNAKYRAEARKNISDQQRKNAEERLNRRDLEHTYKMKGELGEAGDSIPSQIEPKTPMVFARLKGQNLPHSAWTTSKIGTELDDDREFEVPEIKSREFAAQVLQVESMKLPPGSTTGSGTSVNAATDARQISTINNASYQSIGTSAEPRYWGSQAWGGHRRNWGQGRVDIW